MEEEWNFSLDFQRNIDNILSIIIGQMIIFGSDDSKRFAVLLNPSQESRSCWNFLAVETVWDNR